MATKDKDTDMNVDQLYWERVPGSEEYFDRADMLRSRFKVLAAIVLICVVLTPVLCVGIARRAQAPNPVVVLADGRFFSGPLIVGQHTGDAEVRTQMLDTVEFVLTRTEKGALPSLKEYVGPGVTEFVDGLFKSSTKMKSGYTQNYSITSSKVLSSSPGYIVLGVRGLLSSRTLDGYQLSELYFAAGFAPGKKTAANALGWRLIKLSPDPEGALFYHDEADQERAERLGTNSK